MKTFRNSLQDTEQKRLSGQIQKKNNFKRKKESLFNFDY